MTETMELVKTVTVTSLAASIDFTNIPQTGTDLVLLLSGRNGSSGTGIRLVLNADSTTANYYQNSLSGDGATVSSSNSASNSINACPGNTGTANTFGNVEMRFTDYAVNGVTKRYLVDATYEFQGASGGAGLQILGGKWTGTGPITQITLIPGTGTGSGFVVGTTASLYTITKGSGGATVA